tara:strand:- start:108 stop:488 length:381 start_codon:yes stop_codon:yes gene_type:complete
MVFFTAVVSPSIFVSLSNNASSKFLRTIFPRMFLFGFIITVICLVLTLLNGDYFVSLLLIFISLSFIINRSYITPRINYYRDLELEGDQKAKILFKKMHLLSVLMFLINFILLLIIILMNYINYHL